MGMFGPKETVDLSTPGDVVVPPEIRSRVPDAGSWFLQWLSPVLDSDTIKALQQEIDRRRGANGWLAGVAFADVPRIGRQQTPMTFLSGVVGGRSAIALSVWGTLPHRGRSYSALSKTLEGLVHAQGHGAAATWALSARPDARLNLDDLADMLESSWQESVSFVTNGDLIKAVRNWRS